MEGLEPPTLAPSTQRSTNWATSPFLAVYKGFEPLPLERVPSILPLYYIHQFWYVRSIRIIPPFLGPHIKDTCAQKWIRTTIFWCGLTWPYRENLPKESNLCTPLAQTLCQLSYYAFVVPIGSDPTSQVFQTCANPSQLEHHTPHLFKRGLPFLSDGHFMRDQKVPTESLLTTKPADPTRFELACQINLFWVDSPAATPSSPRVHNEKSLSICGREAQIMF